MNSSLAQLTEQFTQLIGSAVAPVASVSTPVPVPIVAAVAAPGSSLATPEKPGHATPAAPAPAAAATPPPPPVRSVDFALKGYHLDATVPATQVVAAAQILDQAGFGLDTITGVDWIAQCEFEVVYDFFHPTSPLRVVVRARVPRTNAELPTIAGVFAGANWHERETHDFFGIRFAGHPNLKPFLLPEDADFHPLLKDYKP